MLMILKNHDQSSAEQSPKVRIAEIGDVRVKSAAFILLRAWKSIIDCSNNEETLEKIIKFINQS